MTPDYYNDDQQGFYYDELIDILRGKSDKIITDDHEQAVNAEIKLRFQLEKTNHKLLGDKNEY